VDRLLGLGVRLVRGLFAVSGIVAAGSVAVAAVAGAAPAAAVAAGAVQEEPAAAGSLSSADEVQMWGLQQLQRLQREQSGEVGGPVRGDLPAHRRSDQIAVGERVE